MNIVDHAGRDAQRRGASTVAPPARVRRGMLRPISPPQLNVQLRLMAGLRIFLAVESDVSAFGRIMVAPMREVCDAVVRLVVRMRENCDTVVRQSVCALPVIAEPLLDKRSDVNGK